MAIDLKLEGQMKETPKVEETLTDRAYRHIEEMIVTLKLEPGDVLSEAKLAGQLSIGRTPVREALQRLSLEGLVVILPRRGILVSEINLSKHMMLLEVRREVERLVARKCALRATEGERAQFAEVAKDFVASARKDDDVAFMRTDSEFNALLLTTCRNELAVRIMGLMQGQSRRFWYRNYQQVSDLQRAANLHGDVARAIANGDPKSAATASDALLDYIAEFAKATV